MGSLRSCSGGCCVAGSPSGAAPALKVVGRLGVGLDNIDVGACNERRIEVIPATGANALAVAEYVLGTALFLLRGAYASSSAVYGDTPAHPQIENTLGRPLSPYAASKSANEIYALAFQMSYGLE